MSDILIIAIISIIATSLIIFIEYKKAMKNENDYLIPYNKKCQELKKENLSHREYRKQCLEILKDPNEANEALQKLKNMYTSIQQNDNIVKKRCIENRKYAYKYDQCILEIFTPVINKKENRRATCGYLPYSTIINALCQKQNISKDEATNIFSEWYNHDMVRRKYNNPEYITLGATLVFFGDIISIKDLTLDKWAFYNKLNQ